MYDRYSWATYDYLIHIIYKKKQHEILLLLNKFLFAADNDRAPHPGNREGGKKQSQILNHSGDWKSCWSRIGFGPKFQNQALKKALFAVCWHDCMWFMHGKIAKTGLTATKILVIYTLLAAKIESYISI